MPRLDGLELTRRIQAYDNTIPVVVTTGCPIDRAKNVAPNILRRYFQKGHGKWDEYIRVKDEVKRMVTFKRFNLLTDVPPHQDFDVIFCRNVMIYFDSTVREKVTNKLYNALK